MACSVTDVKATSKEERRSVAVVGNRSPGLKPSGFAPNRRGNQIEQPAANALATPRGKGVKRDCSEIRGREFIERYALAEPFSGLIDYIQKIMVAATHIT
jgi:hypothetical protein